MSREELSELLDARDKLCGFSDSSAQSKDWQVPGTQQHHLTILTTDPVSDLYGQEADLFFYAEQCLL